jgi:hypothetical protein
VLAFLDITVNYDDDTSMYLYVMTYLFESVMIRDILNGVNLNLNLLSI